MTVLLPVCCLQKIYAALPGLSIHAAAVVGSLARDGHIVRMAFEHAGIGYPGELGIVKPPYVGCAAISHSGTETARQLVDDFSIASSEPIPRYALNLRPLNMMVSPGASSVPATSEPIMTE